MLLLWSLNSGWLVAWITSRPAVCSNSNLLRKPDATADGTCGILWSRRPRDREDDRGLQGGTLEARCDKGLCSTQGMSGFCCCSRLTDQYCYYRVHMLQFSTAPLPRYYLHTSAAVGGLPTTALCNVAHLQPMHAFIL
jgi:hypothetical protein